MKNELIKRMFGTRQWPKIDFDLTGVLHNAEETAGQLSISGVQPKLSVKLDKKKNELISVAKGGEYILKPQTVTYANIPENEQCCMDMAEAFNIEVPPHCLIPLKDNSLAYIVKRFDRDGEEKFHQEHFSQILERSDKYDGTIEQIGKKLKKISTAPGLDSQFLFERVVFSFIIGNGDAHLKNYSVLIKGENIRLSPAYDFVCSRIVIPKEKWESALGIGSNKGKKNDLSRKDFDGLAEYLGVPIKVRYEKFEKKFNTMKEIIKTSKINKEKQANFLSIIKERLHRLELAE